VSFLPFILIRRVKIAEVYGFGFGFGFELDSSIFGPNWQYIMDSASCGTGEEGI